MKIECTKKEKEILLDVLAESCFCHFDFTYCCKGDLCRDCYDHNIEWHIKEGE